MGGLAGEWRDWLEGRLPAGSRITWAPFKPHHRRLRRARLGGPGGIRTHDLRVKSLGGPGGWVLRRSNRAELRAPLAF